MDSLLYVLQSLSQQYLFVALFKYRKLITVPRTQHKPASRHRMIFFVGLYVLGTSKFFAVFCRFLVLRQQRCRQTLIQSTAQSRKESKEQIDKQTTERQSRAHLPRYVNGNQSEETSLHCVENMRKLESLKTWRLRWVAAVEHRAKLERPDEIRSPILLLKIKIKNCR